MAKIVGFKFLEIIFDPKEDQKLFHFNFDDSEHVLDIQYSLIGDQGQDYKFDCGLFKFSLDGKITIMNRVLALDYGKCHSLEIHGKSYPVSYSFEDLTRKTELAELLLYSIDSQKDKETLLSCFKNYSFYVITEKEWDEKYLVDHCLSEKDIHLNKDRKNEILLIAHVPKEIWYYGEIQFGKIHYSIQSVTFVES